MFDFVVSVYEICLISSTLVRLFVVHFFNFQDSV